MLAVRKVYGDGLVAVSPQRLHELLKHCMDFGRIMLEDSGEFYPFGAVIGADGI